MAFSDHHQSAALERQARTIVISVNKAGHVNQCLGFCALMGWPVDEIARVPGASRMQSSWQKQRATLLRIFHVAAKAPRRRQFERLRVVASGFAAESLVQRYRDLYKEKLFAVFVGSPKLQAPIFDFAVASHHALENQEPSGSLYSGAGKTLWMAGVLTRAVDAGGAQSNIVLALIGGLNKAFEIAADPIAKELIAGTRLGHTVVVVFSRRTPMSVDQRLRELLTLPNVQFVDRNDRAGFEAVFSQAREFLVTPDSITMICEACSTGKTVRIFNATCFNQHTSTARFVREFLDKGYVRNVLDAEGATVPLPSREPIRREIRDAYEAWLGT